MEKFKEEKILGTVPKNYQCVENFWDCPEFSKRNKSKKHWIHSVHSNFNGITLIALIITIIVMLILVGVTITVALNGGLFNTAQNAAINTIKASEKERLIEIAVASYNVSEGKISNADELASKIKNSLDFEKDADRTTETKLVVKGKDTLWQIDLATAEVKEYSETIGNAWTKRGLSDSVKYDRNYYGEGGKLDEALSINSMTVQLKSTGEFIIEELEWNYSNEEVEELIKNGELVVTNDSIIFSQEVKWKFNSDGTEIALYKVSTESTDNEHEIVKLNVQN